MTDASTSSAIISAAVSVDGTPYSATTDANGEYTISDVPEATYDVTASAFGYTGETRSVTVIAGSPAAADFQLTPVPQGSAVSVSSIDYSTSGGRNGDKHLLVTVSLVDDSGQPVSGASVTVEVDLDGTSLGTASGTTAELGSDHVNFL